MELVSVIRHKVLTEGVPIRDVARQLGLSRNTIQRYVRAKVVPVPRPARPPRATPTKELVAEAAAIWASRRSFTAGKQRLTATRLRELPRDDGHDVNDDRVVVQPRRRRPSGRTPRRIERKEVAAEQGRGQPDPASPARALRAVAPKPSSRQRQTFWKQNPAARPPVGHCELIVHWTQ